MALIACRECGGQISDQAKACPHCGATKPPPINWIKEICYTVIAISIITYMVSDHSPPAPPPPTAAPANTSPTPAVPPTDPHGVDTDDHLEQCRDMVRLAMRDQGMEAHGILLRKPQPTPNGLQSIWTVGSLRFECLSAPTTSGSFNHWLYHKGQVVISFPDLPGPAH